MRRPLFSLTATVTAATLLLTACSSGGIDASEDPDAALAEALDDASTWGGVTATLSIDAAAASVGALTDMTDEDRRILHYVNSSTVTISSHPGADLEDTDDDVARVAVTVGDIDAFEVRIVDERIFLRADLDAIVDEFGEAGDLDDLTAAAEAFGIADVDAIAAGGWIELSGYRELMAMYMGMTDASTTAADLELFDTIATQAGEGARELFARAKLTHVGEDAAGHHLQVTVTGEQTFDAFRPLLVTFFDLVLEEMGGFFFGADMTGEDLVAELQAADGFADFAVTTIPAQLWVSDGALTQVGFDVVQFADLNPHLADEDDEVAPFSRFAILVGLEAFDGTLDAPADATVIDLFELAGRAMAEQEAAAADAELEYDLMLLAGEADQYFFATGSFEGFTADDALGGAFVPGDDVTFGVTVATDGERFVACVSKVGSDVVLYWDSDVNEISETAPDLTCVPGA